MTPTAHVSYSLTLQDMDWASWDSYQLRKYYDAYIAELILAGADSKLVQLTKSHADRMVAKKVIHQQEMHNLKETHTELVRKNMRQEKVYRRSIATLLGVNFILLMMVIYVMT